VSIDPNSVLKFWIQILTNIAEPGPIEITRLWNGPGVSIENMESMSEWITLAHLILSIPSGSVENERRFSGMNLTVTDLRSRLETEHVNVQLRIATSTFTVKDYPYDECFDHWWAAKDRREVTK
jgi:hAT family C-terminal dimerisation region